MYAQLSDALGRTIRSDQIMEAPSFQAWADVHISAGVDFTLHPGLTGSHEFWALVDEQSIDSDGVATPCLRLRF